MKKSILKSVIVGLIISSTINYKAMADVPANILPVFNNGENVNITTNNANMNIQIQGGENSVGSANWNSFHIGKDAGVNVEFSAPNQTSLNYVEATGGMSQIYGKFTDSGYNDTGKIILQNPNGIFFGNGANVNVNSFTATTMNGIYDKNTQTLKLTKNADNVNKDYGIIVDNGAKINGRNGVAFASNNIDIYKGSQISTKNTIITTDISDYNASGNSPAIHPQKDIQYGNVKLVTSDGVNFTYKNGSVDKANDIQASTDKMILYVAGNVEGANIELNNASTNVNSQINMKNATLKATNIDFDNNGNITLTSGNKIITEDTKIESNEKFVNIICIYPAQADPKTEATTNLRNNIEIKAKNNISLGGNTINSAGDVILKSETGNVNVHNSTVSASDDVVMHAGNVASVQVNSKVSGDYVNINGTNRGQVVSSGVNGHWGNFDITSGNGLVWTKDSTITSANDINVQSKQDGLLLQNTKFEADGNINIQSNKDIKSSDLKDSTFNAKGINNQTGSIATTPIPPVLPSVDTAGVIATSSSPEDLPQDPVSRPTTEPTGPIPTMPTSPITKPAVGNINIKTSNKMELNDLSQFKAKAELNLGGASITVDSDKALDIKNTNFEGMHISLKSKKDDLTIDGNTTKFNIGFPSYSQVAVTDDPGYVYLEAGKNVKSTGKALDTGHFTTINAGNDIDVKLTTDSKYDWGGLTANAGNNISINKNGTIFVDKLKAGNNITLNAKNIEQSTGYFYAPYEPNSVNPAQIPNIEAEGNFNTNVKYDIVSSANNDGQYNTEHIIKIGNSNFYLKTKLPVTRQITPPEIKPRNFAGEVNIYE